MYVRLYIYIYTYTYTSLSLSLSLGTIYIYIYISILCEGLFVRTEGGIQFLGGVEGLQDLTSESRTLNAASTPHTWKLSGVPLKGSIRVPLQGTIRVPLEGSYRSFGVSGT